MTISSVICESQLCIRRDLEVPGLTVRIDCFQKLMHALYWPRGQEESLFDVAEVAYRPHVVDSMEILTLPGMRYEQCQPANGRHASIVTYCPELAVGSA
jgi:hypothetical protein